MESPATARVASASPGFVEQATPPALDDWLSYFDPDIVLVTGDTPAPRGVNFLRRHVEAETLLFSPAGERSSGGVREVAGCQFVLAPTHETLESIRESEGDELDTSKPTFVLSGLLDLHVDTTTLSTSLAGRSEYVAALQEDRLDGEYRHISSRLPAAYRREWDGLAVVGGGVESGRADTPLVALDCRTDGRVVTRSLNRSQLGLRALTQVGKQRARNLRDAGFDSRAAVAGAPQGALAQIDGIGSTTAERVRQSATAIAESEVVRVSDDPLPGDDPVYIDIETDGLSPTITWLVGVLDGTATDGEYRSFLQTDPDNPGGAIAEFMAWYAAEADQRPLVAYHGWQFDFDVIHDHIVEYCPEYEDDWASASRFDPYRWAVKEGNAILPGRTNKLDDVAEALGYESADTGLTGGAVARAYQRWMTDSETEPDWERFESYCEDDVRGLATVHEALEDSGRIVSKIEQDEPTTQRTLSDW